MRVIDLTHPLSKQVPTWNGSCGFELAIKKDYDRVFRVHKIHMHAGVGTHMDAPSHRFEGASCIADIPIQQCVAPLCVIDVAAHAHPEYEMPLEALLENERMHGKIEAGSLVIVYTGWDRFWMDPTLYRGVDERGQMHFPAVSEEAAEALLQRGVVGLAIDTLSPDCLNPDFPVHQLLLKEGKYIIENVAHASNVPARGALGVALPLKAVEATEAPMRFVALLL